MISMVEYRTAPTRERKMVDTPTARSISNRLYMYSRDHPLGALCSILLEFFTE